MYFEIIIVMPWWKFRLNLIQFIKEVRFNKNMLSQNFSRINSIQLIKFEPVTVAQHVAHPFGDTTS